MRSGDKIQGKYEIKEEIGAGSSGCVYKAVYNEHTYAIKVQSIDNISYNLHDREKKVSRKSQHEHIILPHEIFEEEGNICSVMRYVEGKTLSKVLNEKGCFDFKEVIEFGVYYFSALDYMHQNKIIHQNLNPDNIIIGTDNKPYIIGFDSLKFDKNTQSQGRCLFDISNYMAPEVLYGKRQGIFTFRKKEINYVLADIYSTGAICYELLTGKKPVKVKMGKRGVRSVSRAVNIKKYLKENYIFELKKLSSVIMKSLHKNSKKRYQTMDQFYNALHETFKLSYNYKEKRAYFKGTLSVCKDVALKRKSAYFLYKDACQGNTDAMFQLGEMYLYAHEINQNLTELMKWYRKSAELGNTQGMCCLGLAYCSGYEGEYDDEEAARLFQKAADLGDTDGMYHLGHMYLSGDGVEKNPAKGWNLLQKSAELDNKQATYFLSLIYSNGCKEIGIKKDYNKALEWCRKSAELGNAEAMSCLGTSYRSGRKVKRDDVEAEKWFKKAAETRAMM